MQAEKFKELGSGLNMMDKEKQRPWDNFLASGLRYWMPIQGSKGYKWKNGFIDNDKFCFRHDDLEESAR